MASNLISIAASGTAAAQAGLSVTAQNIANAGTSGYVRETVGQVSLNSPEANGTVGGMSMSGVVVTGIQRNSQTYLQNQVNVTASDAAKSNGLVTNLTNVEGAVENANVYGAIGTFQASLQTLASNPTNTSSRQSVLADAQNMAQSFNLAHNTLGLAQATMQSDAASSVNQINQIAGNLAKINNQIGADTDPAHNGAALLDQRDQMLQQLSKLTDAQTTYNPNGTVVVKLGGSSGQTLLTGTSANSLSMATAADGTITLSLAGAAITPSGGALAADSQGLTAAASASTTLDGIAGALITAVNTAQATGANLNGASGAAMFSGTGSGNIAVTMSSPAGIATAAAGSAAGSTDITNLTAMQNALAGSNNIAAQANTLLFNMSSAVQSATTTQTAQTAIAAQAKAQADSAAGVDLNTEAANLLNYQQAFQASAKVMQTAETIFQQLLGIA